MLRLLSIELDKIKRNRAAKVITIVYCSLILGISLFASYEFNFAGINFRIADQGIFNFPFIWHFNGFMASWLKIFLAIVIVSIVANEYSYNTLKQNLIGEANAPFVNCKQRSLLFIIMEWAPSRGVDVASKGQQCHCLGRWDRGQHQS